MGTLFSALEIGRAGMQVAQVQLDVTGHNIANVNKDGFTRQRVEVTTRLPNYKIYGALGRGPAISGVFRLREAFLDTVYRQEVSGLGNAEIQATYFSRLENIFQEPGEDGFSSRLNSFFDSLNDFANNVENLPVRVALLSEGGAVSGTLRDVAQRLRTLRTNANEEVKNTVPGINSLTGRIAELNDAIHDAEISGNPANDLRDDRDNLLDELAGIVAISYNERDNGIVDVLLGSDVLVNGDKARLLETVPDASIDPDRPDLVRVQFVDNGAAATITDGELYGTLHARDVAMVDIEDKMDAIARALIEGINDIHSQGNGLEDYSGPASTTNAVTSDTVALNTAGLPFALEDGSFDVQVFDATGALVETVTVPIVTTGPLAGQTTLADVVTAIDGATNLSATYNSTTGTFEVTPGAGFSFNFANDDAGALTGLGLNTFFTGDSASTIGVNQALVDNPALVSSGFSTDPLETGDNTAALLMAQVRDLDLLSGDTQTINAFFESVIVEVGIDARTNLDSLSVQEAFVQDFEGRRQEASGVSIDEEVTNLIQYQRAFEASARLISVADRMLETLLNIVG